MIPNSQCTNGFFQDNEKKLLLKALKGRKSSWVYKKKVDGDMVPINLNK